MSKPNRKYIPPNVMEGIINRLSVIDSLDPDSDLYRFLVVWIREHIDPRKDLGREIKKSLMNLSDECKDIRKIIDMGNKETK